MPDARKLAQDVKGTKALLDRDPRTQCTIMGVLPALSQTLPESGEMETEELEMGRLRRVTGIDQL